MADNIPLNAGTGGKTLRGEDIGGVIYQDVKLIIGNANVDNGPISLTNPMPISGVGAAVDSFGRQRVSNAINLIDPQFTYNLQPLLFEQIVSGSGATITHDTTNRCALMTFSSTPTGGKSYMQTYEHFKYQAGNSHLIFVTYNMIEGVANCLKFAGYGVHGSNGIFFELSGTSKQITLYSDTAKGDETVPQASWNLDTLDGNGPSQIVLDETDTQIFVIDLQALYVGRVRVGFDIDGVIVYVHEFKHANVIAFPYIQTATLPVVCGMTCTGTVSTTMRFICANVKSEGGVLENEGFPFYASGAVTAANGVATHVLSVRPLTTFNSIENRIKFVPESLDVYVTGNNGVEIELAIGQALTGAVYASVNSTYSGFEADNTGVVSGSPAIRFNKFYCGASAGTKQAVGKTVAARYPITLDAAGAIRALGTLSVLATGIGGTSAMRATLNWREVR